MSLLKSTLRVGAEAWEVATSNKASAPTFPAPIRRTFIFGDDLDELGDTGFSARLDGQAAVPIQMFGDQ